MADVSWILVCILFFFLSRSDCCKDIEGRTDCPGQWEFGWWGTCELGSKLSPWKQCFVFPAGWLLWLGWLFPLRGSDWLIWSMWMLFWGDRHHMVGVGTPCSLGSFPAHAALFCDFCLWDEVSQDDKAALCLQVTHPKGCLVSAVSNTEVGEGRVLHMVVALLLPCSSFSCYKEHQGHCPNLLHGPGSAESFRRFPNLNMPYF